MAMDKIEIVWRLLMAGIAVWRLSRLLFGEPEGVKQVDHGEVSNADLMGVGFWGQRVLDLMCWISVSLSSRTALWVACGLAGVFLSWIALVVGDRFFGSLLRNAGRSQMKAEGVEIRHNEMQVHHG